MGTSHQSERALRLMDTFAESLNVKGFKVLTKEKALARPQTAKPSIALCYTDKTTTQVIPIK